MAKRPVKLSPELINAATWQTFYHNEGRTAIAALFNEFGVYGIAPAGIDPHEVMRREGQRDVLMRIVQMIGLKPEAAPTDAWDDVDILDRMMRTE
jgi:hypothetical protein